MIALASAALVSIVVSGGCSVAVCGAATYVFVRAWRRESRRIDDDGFSRQFPPDGEDHR